MESLRMLQQQALRQLMRTRSVKQPLNFQQLHQQAQHSFRTRTTPIKQVRSFHYTRRPVSATFKPSNGRFRIPRRFNTTTAQSEQQLSLSQKLKKLSREYGWSAVGVYLLLSALDFPFCFMAVRLLGVDRIGHWEHVIMEQIKTLIKWPLGGEAQDAVDEKAEETEKTLPLQGEVRLLEERSAAQQERYEIEDHGYKEAEKANSGSNASIWTQLALAYAIHKSFIFIRVPLTAAVTPKVVKTLRGWGWNIGKMPARKGKSTTGVNTNGSKVRPDD